MPKTPETAAEVSTVTAPPPAVSASMPRPLAVMAAPLVTDTWLVLLAWVMRASMPSPPEWIEVPVAVVTLTPMSPARPVPAPFVLADMPTPLVQIAVPLLFTWTVTVPVLALVPSEIAAWMPVPPMCAPEVPMLALAVTFTPPAVPSSSASMPLLLAPLMAPLAVTVMPPVPLFCARMPVLPAEIAAAVMLIAPVSAAPVMKASMP